MKRSFLAAAAAFAACAGAASLEAQTDSNLLKREWRQEDHWADTYDKPFFILTSPVEDSDANYSVFHWDSLGRVKTSREERDPSFWIGYRILTVGITSNEPLLDGGLYDISVAFAGRLGSLGTGWVLEAAGGAGTANDGAWSNTNAIYGVATVEAIHELSPHEYLHLGITYDGNHALLPGMPVPVVMYEAQPAPNLRLRAGFPHVEADWKPFDPLSIQFIADYPFNMRLHIEAALGEGFAVFTEAARRVDPFHIRESGHERVFYQLQTVEGGLRWVTPWIDISLVGGWAFGQKLFTGYDIRERTSVATLGDGPFVGVTLQGVF
jgi:hypothetical protein